MQYRVGRGAAIYLQNSLANQPEHIIDGNDLEGDIIKDKSALATIESILKHKTSVKKKLTFLVEELEKRAENHDNSKLQQPELNYLIEMDKEGRKKYGSQEYFDKMKRWEKFFKHHYENNRHHPDHFSNGVEGMNLIDLCEYIVDIISYYDNMHVEDAIKTINEQKTRFKFDDQLTQILKNTLLEYFTWFGDYKPPIQETN